MTGSLILLPAPRRIVLQPDPRCRVSDAAMTSSRTGDLPPQGYRITIEPRSIDIVSRDEAGAFYAQQTLVQLRRQYGDEILCGEIEDWPDFAVRGVMLDISRDKVPTMATLFMLVDLFAELKINQLQLYTEHTFAYANHPDVWRDASPMTPAEIQELDRYLPRAIHRAGSESKFIRPHGALAQASALRAAGEKPDGFTFPWGTRHEGGFSLNPLDPRSLELIESLYDELLPIFTSRLLNVGCDETSTLAWARARRSASGGGRNRFTSSFS
jgi:hypothetical protein